MTLKLRSAEPYLVEEASDRRLIDVEVSIGQTVDDLLGARVRGRRLNVGGEDLLEAGFVLDSKGFLIGFDVTGAKPTRTTAVDFPPFEKYQRVVLDCVESPKGFQPWLLGKSLFFGTRSSEGDWKRIHPRLAVLYSGDEFLGIACVDFMDWVAK